MCRWAYVIRLRRRHLLNVCSRATYLRRQYLSYNLGELLTFPVPADVQDIEVAIRKTAEFNMIIRAKAREYVFIGVGLCVCVCVCVSVCDHDN